jgi:D-alanyl-D-alanine carboxypeptidase
MGLRRGFHCFLWGSVASLLCASPTNSDRDVKSAPTRVQASAGLVLPDAAPVRSNAAAVRADAVRAQPDAALAEPAFRLAAVTPSETKVSPPNVTAPEPTDDCLLAQDCIDQYLWSLYERARKIDTNKVQERYKVTIKKKGKKRTVTRTRIKLVTEDFTWKDPDAAAKVGMSMQDYVIGGMERSFRLKLYRLMRAADEAGLAPGITSGFRDDYRQSIASGRKAATDSSYHGGSRRGGYGHGLAADVVSTKGETRAERWITTDLLWKWIDEHGAQYGIGRPYLDRDPPHITPIDSKEYVDKRGLKRAGS